MEYRFSARNRLSGLFLFVAIVFLFMALYNIAIEGRFFSREYSFYTILERGDGLSTRTRIDYKGLKAGYVSVVELDESARIVVRFSVYPEFYEHMRGFTYIKLTSGSIIGGRALELVPEGKGDLVLETSKIPSDKDPEVLARAQRGELTLEPDSIGSNVEKILSNVAVITDDLKKISGAVSGSDRSVELAMQNLSAASLSLRQFAGALRASSPEIRRTVSETRSTVEGANKFLKAFSFSSDSEPPRKLYSVDTRDLD